MIIELGKKIRIERILSNYGVCNRSQVPQFLKEKRVTVLGKKVTPATKANTKDVRIDGKPIENNEPLHIAVHKPSGYICSTVNDGDHKVIYDILPNEFIKRKPTLSIAGRLDKWVTGLVIMSQDGKLVERIITPKDNGCGKDYEVVLKDKLVGDEVEAFESGTMMLRGETEPCKPAKLQILDADKNKVKVTLFEGRYHQIRRMFAATENKAIEIHRTRIGPIELGNLEVGKWRYLSEKELEELYKIETTQTLEKHKKKKKLDLLKVKKSNNNNSTTEDNEENDDEFEDEDEESEYEDEELEEEDKFNFDKMYNEKGELILKYNKSNDKNPDSIDQINSSTSRISKNIKSYQDKLNLLVQSEENEIKKSEIFNQKQQELELLKKKNSGKNNYDINDIDEDEEENNYLEELDEEDEEELERINKKKNDPYQDIRKQFHDKFKLMIKSTDKDAQFDEETGYYIPKSKRVLNKKHDISDRDLDRLMSLDKDMKLFAKQQQEEELELQKMNESTSTTTTPSKKSERKEKYSSSNKKSKSPILSSSSSSSTSTTEDNNNNIIDQENENLIQIDSTPEKIKKPLKSTSSFKSRPSHNKINKKKNSRRSSTNKK